MIEKITFGTAAKSDSAAILQLLSEAGLPSEGVVEHLECFTVTHDGSKQVIGVAGVERYGKTGLLRSVAVASDWQKSGIGAQLVAAALQKAQLEGIEEIVLLTTTARDYFARQFGFSETARQTYDEILKDSVEWDLPRCSTAVVMRLNLSRKKFKE